MVIQKANGIQDQGLCLGFCGHVFCEEAAHHQGHHNTVSKYVAVFQHTEC
jgi:hypothetical protein